MSIIILLSELCPPAPHSPGLQPQGLRASLRQSRQVHQGRHWAPLGQCLRPPGIPVCSRKRRRVQRAFQGKQKVGRWLRETALSPDGSHQWCLLLEGSPRQPAALGAAHCWPGLVGCVPRSLCSNPSPPSATSSLAPVPAGWASGPAPTQGSLDGGGRGPSLPE